jgi:hypothetical protein
MQRKFEPLLVSVSTSRAKRNVTRSINGATNVTKMTQNIERRNGSESKRGQQSFGKIVERLKLQPKKFDCVFFFLH